VLHGDPSKAISNRTSVAAGLATLNSTSPTEAQQDLYSLSQSDFNVISSGTNGGYNAVPGYNLVTGLGSPVANLLVSDMIAGNFPASGRVAAINASLNGNAASNNLALYAPANAMNVFAALIVAPSALGPGRVNIDLASPGPDSVAISPVDAALGTSHIQPAATPTVAGLLGAAPQGFAHFLDGGGRAFSFASDLTNFITQEHDFSPVSTGVPAPVMNSAAVADPLGGTNLLRPLARTLQSSLVLDGAGQQWAPCQDYMAGNDDLLESDVWGSPSGEGVLEFFDGSEE
jgi:hypothetical protein